MGCGNVKSIKKMQHIRIYYAKKSKDRFKQLEINAYIIAEHYYFNIRTELFEKIKG